jgi:hypothetical protein
MERNGCGDVHEACIRRMKMNKRMLELYKQAQVPGTAIDPSNNMPYATTHFSADKFAQLIVLETLDQVNKNMELTWVEGEVKIKQHFGVEE